MTIYLTTNQYNGISALVDQVGSLGLSWIEFMELHSATITPNDYQANIQNQNPYFIHIHIPASQWAQAIPIIANGLNSIQLNLGAITGAFQVGETVTQATSGATGTVYSISGTTMIATGISSGPFDTSHVVTGGTSGATSTPASTTQSPNIAAYTLLAYLFNANINNDETAANIIPFQFEPQFTYEYVDPFTPDTDMTAVFQNMRASTAATFALYYIDGTPINTQNVTTDANGTAVVTFNTGVLSAHRQRCL